MGRVKTHIAISLDGYIAHKDGDTSWIPRGLAKAISEIYNTSDILLAGSKTYETIYEQSGGRWLYKNSYVVTHYDSSPLANKSLQFLFENPINKIEKIKQSVTGDIIVIGGGNLITTLLNNGLLDELHLYIVPVLLGDGIRFLGKTYDINIKSTKPEEYKGTTKICYTFI